MIDEKTEIKSDNLFYKPMFTSNGNVIDYPSIGFHKKELALKWLNDNLEKNKGLEAQIIEEHYYTYKLK